MSRWNTLSELEIRRAVLISEWTEHSLSEAVEHYKRQRRNA